MSEIIYILAFQLKMPNFNKPEIIINTYSNFKSKLSYFEKAYNNDFTLKSNPNIKILNAVSSDYILDITDVLFDNRRG